MKLEAEVGKCLCYMPKFIINDIQAGEDDFGSGWDHSPDDAEDYCCGNYMWERKPATQEVLNKYNISISEYCIICDMLEEKLSFGACGWCS